MIVRVGAIKLALTLVVAVHPVTVLGKARHPNEFVARVPIGRPVVVGLISNINRNIDCALAMTHLHSHNQQGNREGN